MTNATVMQRVIAGLSIAASLGFSQVVAAQRGANPPSAASSSTAENPAGIVSFKIHVDDAVLIDLRDRLARARFADEIPDVGWDYGTNLAYLKDLVTYWRGKYDWRAQERQLNQFDQFKTQIDGVNVHFIHQRSKNPNATPLLLLNGWPSSIVEYTKVIGPLTDPVAHGGRAEDAFHVVIPVMPGYGFSDKPRERGYNPERIANMWATLMARLGYTRYGTTGSDWGASVANRLALKDAAHMSALHLTTCGGGGQPPAAQVSPAGVPTPPRLVPSGGGYIEIQSTKPQTLGQGLSDSPVGLASWIVEKWYEWSDHAGDLEKVYTKDELLTNIMIYWVTNTGTSSTRLYYETRHVGNQLLPSFGDGFSVPLPQGRINLPTGCGTFPSQYDRRGRPAPDTAAARNSAALRYNIVHFTAAPTGGHFPALEQPTLWVDDLRAFFRDHR